MSNKRQKGSGVRESRERNFQCLYRRYRTSARKRKLEFNLPIELFRSLTKRCCYACGAKPYQIYVHDKNKRYRYGYKYMGLDRIENKQGYVFGNVMPLCGRCNVAKLDDSLEGFLTRVYDVYHNRVLPLLTETNEESDNEEL